MLKYVAVLEVLSVELQKASQLGRNGCCMERKRRRMKLERDAELTMLELVVKPKIQKARECLQAGKTEEVWKMIAHDMVGLFQPYRNSEREKYDNVLDSLKEAPIAERMLKNAELYQNAIDLLWDEKADMARPIDEKTLNAVENIVDDIMHS